MHSKFNVINEQIEVDEYFHNLGFGRVFIIMIPNPEAIKETVDKI